MSNLEPGCKAVIIGGLCHENIGKIVTVGNFLGNTSDQRSIFEGDMWEVDKPIIFRSETTTTEKTLYQCSGKTMQRIDDHDTNIRETEKELELTTH